MNKSMGILFSLVRTDFFISSIQKLSENILILHTCAHLKFSRIYELFTEYVKVKAYNDITDVKAFEMLKYSTQ